MTNNGNKTFKTLTEQESYLIKTKNITESPIIANVLSERAYVAIINPYKKVFAKGKNDDGHVYPENVDFNTYVELAALDDYCSFELFKWIGIFEKKLKWALAYEISRFLNQEGDMEGVSYVDYLTNFFETGSSIYLHKIGMASIDTFYTSRGIEKANDYYIGKRCKFLKTKLLHVGNKDKTSKNSLVRHYQKKHKKVPFWLLVHELTIGELQLLFNILNKTLRLRVTERFNYTDPNPKKMVQFSGQIETIRSIRNVISHNEPLFGFVQDKSKQRLVQVDKTIDLLKSIFEKSTIPNANLANLDEISIHDFNKKTVETYKNLYNKISK